MRDELIIIGFVAGVIFAAFSIGVFLVVEFIRDVRRMKMPREIPFSDPTIQRKRK